MRREAGVQKCLNSIIHHATQGCAGAEHPKVNSFVLRRRDAVVSRAVWKKFTDLQRVLNFRKIRIFDRFIISHNFKIR